MIGTENKYIAVTFNIFSCKKNKDNTNSLDSYYEILVKNQMHVHDNNFSQENIWRPNR
jgi:hypothetical protein